MLPKANLKKEFWVESLHITSYLINRSLSITIDLKTLIGMYIGQVLDFKNLRSFGCTFYVNIREYKLGLRALKCVFLGYHEIVKAYKLWCIEDGNKRMIVSRDVTFNQSIFLVTI